MSSDCGAPARERAHGPQQPVDRVGGRPPGSLREAGVQALLAEEGARRRRWPRSRRPCRGPGCPRRRAPASRSRTPGPGRGRAPSRTRGTPAAVAPAAHQQRGVVARVRAGDPPPAHVEAGHGHEHARAGSGPPARRSGGARISPGPSSWRASVRSSVTVTAMKRAAGMPFPHTSPTATTSRSSDTRRTSKRSPPTCRAGSMVAWTSSPGAPRARRRGRKGGCPSGSRGRWPGRAPARRGPRRRRPWPSAASAPAPSPPGSRRAW